MFYRTMAVQRTRWLTTYAKTFSSLSLSVPLRLQGDGNYTDIECLIRFTSTSYVLIRIINLFYKTWILKSEQIPKPNATEGLGIEWPAQTTDMDKLKALFEELKAKM